MTNPTDSSPPQPWQAAYAYAGIAPHLLPLAYTSLPHMVQASCQSYGKQTAFTCVVPNGMNGSLSFTQVDEHSDAFAAYLRGTLGLPAGSRVAVQLPNSLGYPVAAFGALKAGCILVNVNPLYTVSELVHQLNDCNAVALVIVDMFAGKLPEVLRQTGVKHVVVAAVTEFFPAIPNAVVRAVQKVWTRVLPPIEVPHTRMRKALEQGRTGLSAGVVNAYWKDIQPIDAAALQ